MHICFRLSRLGFGGTERVFLSLANYFSRAWGWKIDFVVDQFNNTATEQVAKDAGYTVISLEAPRSFAAVMPFRKYLAIHNPTIVVSAFTETNAAALLSNIFQFRKTPLIVTEHASLDEHWAEKSKLRKLMLEFIVGYVYRLADGVICVSAGMAEQLRRRLRHERLSYFHNPIRFAKRLGTKLEARMNLGIDANVKMILAVGRVSKQKNYLMLLNSIALMRKSLKSKLYIVGGVFEVTEKMALDQYITDNSLDSLVSFVEFTNNIQDYYEAADIFVLSSAWEGFGNVLVEALAFGLPVVSTDCNFGPSEILANGKYGKLVSVNDFSAMSTAIVEILNENPFPIEIQIERAKDFSEENIGSAYRDFLIETVAISLKSKVKQN